MYFSHLSFPPHPSRSEFEFKIAAASMSHHILVLKLLHRCTMHLTIPALNGLKGCIKRVAIAAPKWYLKRTLSSCDSAALVKASEL